MLHLLTRSRSLLGRQSFPWRQCYSHAATRRSEPLRILFCGSDDFSCASLKAVYEEHSRNKDLIESLDVMVLPPKRMGRSFKTLREVPCKILAEELGLRIHQRETFYKMGVTRGYKSSTKYGGLNVHPSLLPDLRGPAPIHHAILRGYQNTGVSLQTLDDKAFDHGTVLAQTPRPGIPIPSGCTVQELTSLLAPIGAQMLVQGLRDGVHVPPHQSVDWKTEDLKNRKLAHAPKVTKADGQINWGDWTADEFVRRVRVLGSVWTHAVNKKGQTKRLIFQDAEVASLMDLAVYGSRMSLHLNLEPGLEEESKYEALVTDQRDGSAIIHIPSGELIWVRKIKEEGKPERDATIVLKSFQ
ncbi:hypothetical protein CEP52_009933 [Fusarium oligoseptatum]|uniref:methionyl-tRNA formyltransferase n=1 Tax=Fusarium oligoseptatum TaxID=2604345 RepID=A0A428TAM6_9HYPO|nr:hypothetical protein CEP52_009933 [Fusarium oligoseptatum]